MYYEIARDLGKSFFFSGLLPALIFVFLNAFFIMPPSDSPGLIIKAIKDNYLEVFLIAIIALAVMLLVLNLTVIKFYEGSYKISKFLLRFFHKRNLSRHEKLYKTLQVYKEEYVNTNDDVKKNSLAHAIEQEWTKVLPAQNKFFIPMDKRRVLPTRLGNIFAIIEEYPSIRYGMDGMVFWPRLIPVIPKEYSAMIASEKIGFDFLLNLSLLSGILGLETFVKFLSNLRLETFIISLDNFREFKLLFLSIMFTTLFYLFYRISLTTILSMGNLVKSCYDLFRHDVLKRMNINIPDNIEEERLLWYRLSNYFASGELFHYPNSEKNRAI